MRTGLPKARDSQFRAALRDVTPSANRAVSLGTSKRDFVSACSDAFVMASFKDMLRENSQ